MVNLVGMKVLRDVEAHTFSLNICPTLLLFLAQLILQLKFSKKRIQCSMEPKNGLRFLAENTIRTNYKLDFLVSLWNFIQFLSYFNGLLNLGFIKGAHVLILWLVERALRA
ncbi:uncharacterized protein LOC111405594 isoform X4 [Olea europaea var. sylvestris]|uniref:uncharacterized protein LOC111405594 isoform X4 n=1 Tax=Olea europaea var. sylvestris TaxID=158386 RepID=UPI000C1D5FCB|nr:uncharacterized protein LOC111405594 isoform X4 [Olea europaea var. sylvestris]XP_022890317.1 uncharacterized protein LOC111405594 isoform X4 [Olea europaea var. sylvestris]